VNDTRIAADIEALRATCPDTRALYREVCGLLFFRYGITPTANKLYQYVRKGSMSTPAEVLTQFWGDLRERSRVRIDHPDLPEPLRERAGELVLELWGLARQGADEAFAARSRQVESDRADMDTRMSALASELANERAQRARLEQELAASRAHSEDLAREVATAQGRLASMTEMLRDQSDDTRRMGSELAAARTDVARAIGEANALRVQLAIASSRATRKPLGGIPGLPDPGQESLGLDSDLGP
jgi:septal ring factor EnvC (AmiA/AmiB activator)